MDFLWLCVLMLCGVGVLFYSGLFCMCFLYCLLWCVVAFTASGV